MKNQLNYRIDTMRKFNSGIASHLYYMIKKDNKMNKIFYSSGKIAGLHFQDSVDSNHRPDYFKADSAEFPHIFIKKIWENE